MSHGNLDHSKKPSALENFLFTHRGILLAIFALMTLVLGYLASQQTIEASFNKMVPASSPYISNYFKYQDEFQGMNNVVRLALETTEGDIFTPEYLEQLRLINDEIFYIPGVDRAWLKSLWTPLTRWTEVTEQGFSGGPVIPDRFDGSPEAINQLRDNLRKSGEIGRLVANNFKSSIILIPLREIDPETGEALNYKDFCAKLETLVRDKFQTDNLQIHITGFAKVVGDLIEGATQVAVFFTITILFTLMMVFFYVRCLRSAFIMVLCALLAVVWQAGVLQFFGFTLDPYSMLVPFLVFAIGVSHGVQMLNGIKHQMSVGQNQYDASRTAFRFLYIAALCALVTDGVGFAILYVIDIGVLRDMAIGAAVRFPVLILGALVLLPILMSYFGLSRKSVERTRSEENIGSSHPVFTYISRLTRPKPAIAVLLVVSLATLAGIQYRKNLQIGDLDAGASELRPDSRYNLDDKFMNENYAVSSDVFVVMVETPKERNGDYYALTATDRLQRQLEALPEVQSVSSLSGYVKQSIFAFNEGNLKWYSLVANQQMLDSAALSMPAAMNLTNRKGDLSKMLVYLNDHKAATLSTVVEVVERFEAENNTGVAHFLLAAGNAGIEAATNIEIEKAQVLMLFLVYGVVGVLVLLTFRSWRATLCIMIPLALTSLLCEVLMTYLGIGVKVATLPVISVGVGIGVDYGVYIFSRLKSYLEEGYSLEDAYYNTLMTTGKAVAFTGITLTIGVTTWVFSPIKFQADMGLLLAFMFAWNMIGALVLLPVLSRYLLKESKVAVVAAESQT